jgi:predicted dehydrogenase
MMRVGVVGFGLGGRVLHAPVIAGVEGMELAAVVERSTNLAAERYPGITVYRSLDTMLTDNTLDLIVITTPTASHYELARQVLTAGKHLVVDKPVCIHSREVAELTALAHSRQRLFVPYHNRRWDADFRTVERLLQQGTLGRVVAFHSAMDRWRPGSTRTPWKDDSAAGGGKLYDLGSHLIYQALVLFGLPEAVGAETVRERDGEGADDAFTVRLHYPGLTATLEATNVAAIERPRFYVRGLRGTYRKHGVEPQEEALQRVTRAAGPEWGREPEKEWGELTLDVEGKLTSSRVEPLPGDYRIFYAGVRDALLGKAAPPVPALEAWRTIRILELAVEASRARRIVACDWSAEPV